MPKNKVAMVASRGLLQSTFYYMKHIYLYPKKRSQERRSQRTASRKCYNTRKDRIINSLTFRPRPWRRCPCASPRRSSPRYLGPAPCPSSVFSCCHAYSVFCSTEGKQTQKKNSWIPIRRSQHIQVISLINTKKQKSVFGNKK